MNGVPHGQTILIGHLPNQPPVLPPGMSVASTTSSTTTTNATATTTTRPSTAEADRTRMQNLINENINDLTQQIGVILSNQGLGQVSSVITTSQPEVLNHTTRSMSPNSTNAQLFSSLLTSSLLAQTANASGQTTQTQSNTSNQIPPGTVISAPDEDMILADDSPPSSDGSDSSSMSSSPENTEIEKKENVTATTTATTTTAEATSAPESSSTATTSTTDSTSTTSSTSTSTTTSTTGSSDSNNTTQRNS